MNAVVAAVAIMLVLSLCRIHVVVALIVGAVAGGLVAGLSLDATLSIMASAAVPRSRFPTQPWAHLR